MNEALRAIQPHPSKTISDRIRAIPDAVDLTVGIPSFGPPAVFRDRVAELVNEGTETDRYADSRGLMALRSAITDRYRERTGVERDPSREVLVTHGAAEAIWMVVFALTNPGEEVLIPNPGYMLYAPIVASLGRSPAYFDTTSAQGFIPSLDSIVNQVTNRTRLIIINTPANPTGGVYPQALLDSVAAFCSEHGVYLMQDEVFDDTVFSGSHYSLIGSSEWEHGRIVAVNSLSKRFGMTGWRVGWVTAAQDVVDVILKSHTYALLACNTLAQAACIPLFDSELCACELDGNLRLLRNRRERSIHVFSEIGMEFPPQDKASGGFYLFPDVSRLAERLGYAESNGSTMGEYIADRLLHLFHVGVVPGIAFGSAGANHVRISVAGPDERLVEASHRLDKLMQ